MNMTMNMHNALNGLPQKPRAKHEFYETPPKATLALINAEQEYLPRHIWEPAAGGCALARVLVAGGYEVTASDLVLHDQDESKFPDIPTALLPLTEPLPHPYPVVQKDFLAKETTAPCDGIVTNPPFNLAKQFIEKGRDMEIPYMALLVKCNYWHASSRTELFRSYPPSVIYALNWRLDFNNEGRPVMDCSWMVWCAERRAKSKDTIYKVLGRP